MICPSTAAEIQPRAVVVPRPAGLIPLAQRALVFLRDGLTADSTGRTIPELKRAGRERVLNPTDPNHQPGSWGARPMATFRYSVS